MLQPQSEPPDPNRTAQAWSLRGPGTEDAMPTPSDLAAAPLPDSEPERPTLKTIAAATGLAIATVSRALKDAPDIGEETKRRVRETAALLGYRPNRAGVRLRTGKTNVIALVLSTETDMMNHTSRLIYSIASALRGTAYHLVVMPFFPDQDPMEPIRYIVETESADGVILNQTKEDDPRIRYMQDRGFPFAAHGRTAMGIDHAYFDFDNQAFGRLGARALAERGRKRLLLVAPPRSHMYARHMITGLFRRSRAARRAVRNRRNRHVRQRRRAGRGRHHRPLPPTEPTGRACCSGSTTAAMAAVAGAESSGRVLGRDFDVVAKEAIPLLRRFRQDILIIREDVGRAGDFLARALLAQIEKRDWPDRQGLEVPVKVESGRQA